MKNSSKFLLAAVLVLLASLTAYNMALRTEYRLGAYKDPLRGYAELGFKNFTKVAVPAANVVNVKIVSGPFSVRISPRVADYVHVSQQNGRLLVTAAFPEQRPYLGWQDAVLISCPQLATLATDAVYQVAGQSRSDKNEPFVRGRTLVQGFVQDSLTVRADRASHIELMGNKLGLLRATTGATLGSHTTLTLGADNRISAARLDLQHQSELKMNNVLIPDLRYLVADSAQALLGGAVLRSLSQK